MPRYADTSRYTAEEALLWKQIRNRQGCELFTSKRLPFIYEIKGNEIFISRKE